MQSKVVISKNLNSRVEAIKKNINELDLLVEHPDVLVFKDGEKLGVGVVQAVQKFLHIKPHTAKVKFVAFESAQDLTNDAQNALLKILEEPPLYATVILGADKQSSLLPTVLSRCEIEIVNSSSEDESKIPTEIENVLEMSVDQRFTLVELTENKEELLDHLILYIRELVLQKKLSPQLLKELIELEKWRNSNGNIRSILEYLMLTLNTKFI